MIDGARWIAMKCCTDTQDPQRMYPTNSGEPPTSSPLAPPAISHLSKAAYIFPLTYTHWEQFGVKLPAQGHIDMWIGGA